MERLIFRNDDVSFNTNKSILTDIYQYLQDSFKNIEIWSCITLFSKSCNKGSVYPNPPFKDMSSKDFYKIDSFLSKDIIPYLSNRIASHGLIHFDHSKLNRETQAMSILTSCNFLNTRIFVPPFNRHNKITREICAENGINLIKIEDGWKSLECNEFDPEHKFWYFHSWRWNLDSFKEKIESGCIAQRR